MIQKTVRVGCYVRVSTENQIENYSIEAQIERLKAYCQAKDWQIFKFYTDAGFSGGNINRPALNQMLSDINHQKFDMVVVYKLDRLSRSQKDTLTLIEDSFLQNRIDFVSISENFDTSTPFGRAMIGILSVFSQLEKDQITERFTMGRIARNAAGYYHGGSTAPTGYDYIDGLLVVNDYKALQVREAFDRFLRGNSLNSIQEYMHQEYGGWSSASHVLNVLRNTVYIGKVKFKGVACDGIHEPIVSIQTFYQAQALLNSPEREESKTSAQKTPFKAGFLLSSLIVCSKCNARYSGNHGFYKCYSRSKSNKKYITDSDCKNDNWKIEKLDKFIIDEIYKLKYQDAYLDSIFNKKEIETPAIDVTSLRTRIKELDSQISKVIDLYQLGTIPMEEISSRVDALQSEKNTLTNQLNPMKNQNSKISKQSFLQLLDNAKEVFECGDLAEKRIFVSSLIETIFIDGGQINIKWRI